jgi:hypothetical protein
MKALCGSQMVRPEVIEQALFLVIVRPEGCDLPSTSCNGDDWDSVIADFANEIEGIVDGIESAPAIARSPQCVHSWCKDHWFGIARDLKRERVALTGINYRQWLDMRRGMYGGS